MSTTRDKPIPLPVDRCGGMVCPTPRKRRWRRNTLWVCPRCNRVWVLQYSSRSPENSLIGYDMAYWNWFRWSPRAD